MGLSTAQARLLTITARKSDCEFLSMSLSHQKIALSRDMENVSTEYQNALDATKLVYDYYGSGTSDMDLSYGLLMTPSIYNDYYPKLVTDSKNRVVLNSSYAAAARAAGIPAEGLSGTPSSDVRNAFVEALAGENIITAAKAATIQGVTYGNTLGVGSTVSTTAGTTTVTYDELIQLIEANCQDNTSWTAGDGTFLSLGTHQYDGNTEINTEHFTVYDDAGNRTENYEGTNSSASITLADLLSGKAQYNLSMESVRAERTPIVQTAYLQEKIIGSSENSASLLNWMVDQFSAILGGVSSNDLALQHAYNAVYDLIYPNSDIQNAANFMTSQGSWSESLSDRKHGTEPSDGQNSNDRGLSYGELMDEVGTRVGGKIKDGYDPYTETVADDYLGFVYTCDRCHSGKARKQTSEVSINLNNIAEVFLTSFVEYQKGLDQANYSYTEGKKSDSILYDPNNDDFVFTIPTEGTSSTDDECVEASFYDTLFNRICLDGWVENDQIEDTSYMQEMMKTGKLFISSISDDGYYYQGNYSTDQYISEVTDDEAVAKAEAKYNTEKTKIQNKENTIDMKMKNLDTEISSLTTEYDTTKSIISKSIEKSFKRYDA